MSIFDDEMVVGRKAIVDFLGVKSWRTVRRWKKRYRMRKLIMQLPNGRPFLLKSEVRLFLLAFNQYLREHRKEVDPQ